MQSKTKKTISPPQIKLVHVLKGKLNLSDDAYRDMLLGWFNAKTCKDLSPIQAKQLIDHLIALGKPAAATPRSHGRPQGDNVVYLASKAQKWKIDELVELLGWDNPDRLAGFIKRMTKNKKALPSQLTSLQASRVIDGLKAIKTGGRQERHRASPDS